MRSEGFGRRSVGVARVNAKYSEQPPAASAESRSDRRGGAEPACPHGPAGLACTSVTDATTVDSIVMASAAQRGDIVYTSDIENLQRLQSHFESVPRVLRA
jgi:hypothetical protein